MTIRTRPQSITEKHRTTWIDDPGDRRAAVIEVACTASSSIRQVRPLDPPLTPR
jgi:hypothetical protein